MVVRPGDPLRRRVRLMHGRAFSNQAFAVRQARLTALIEDKVPTAHKVVSEMAVAHRQGRWTAEVIAAVRVVVIVSAIEVCLHLPVPAVRALSEVRVAA